MNLKKFFNKILKNVNNALKGIILSFLVTNTSCVMASVPSSDYVLQTVVGNGNYSNSSLESNGTHWDAVGLGSPNCVLKDPTDNSIIFYDNDHSAIRVAYASGAVSTILSSFTSSAQQCLSINPTTGDLYRTDGTNLFLMTKSGSISSATYNSTTLLSEQSNISAIIYDSVNDYLYFSVLNSEIYQLKLSDSTLKPLTAGFTSKHSLALNSAATTLYFLENSSFNSIRKLSVPFSDDDSAIEIGGDQAIAGNASAGSWFNSSGSSPTDVSLSDPQQISVDANNDIYVTDTGYIGKITGINDGFPTLNLFAGGSEFATGVNTDLAALTGIFVDDNNSIFITQAGGSDMSSKNLISRIYEPISVSIPSGTTATTTNLNVPYYAKLNIIGGGTLAVLSSNASTMFGEINLSGSGTTASISNANALGNGNNVENKVTLGASTTLVIGGNFTIPQSIIASGSSTISIANHDVTFSGQFSGNGPLTLAGIGSVILSGVSSVSNGIIFYGVSSSLTANNSSMMGGFSLGTGTTTFSNVNALGGGSLTLNGTTLKAADSLIPSTLSQAITCTANSSINTNGKVFTISGAITGAYTLEFNGEGIVTLSSNNSLSSSVLKVGSSTMVIINTANNLTQEGLFLNGGVLKTESAMTLSQAITCSADSVINSNGQAITLSGEITGSHDLTLNGRGIFTLSHDNSTSLNGGVTLSDAGTTAIIGSANHLGSGGSENIVTLNNQTTLKIGNTINNLIQPIAYSGNVSIDTATNSLTPSAITCSDPANSILTVKGGGNVTLPVISTVSTTTVKALEKSTLGLAGTMSNINIKVADGSTLNFTGNTTVLMLSVG